MALKICFVAAEVAPLAKTGGLADVAHALPDCLQRAGHDVRVFMPWYASIATGQLDLQAVPTAQNVEVQFNGIAHTFSLYAGRLPRSSATLYLVQCPALYHRSSLYTVDPDEDQRFLLLQRAVLESCQRLQFAPDIVHCNDWHTGLLPLLLKTTYAWDRLFAGTKTLLTIHNIGYQGVFPFSSIQHLRWTQPATLLQPEDYALGRINWLKEGIAHADRVSTVSPTYAREICTPQGGYGLDATLRARGADVVGILNGVDYREWNPSSDPHLAHHYDPAHLEGKLRNKQALFDRRGMHLHTRTPLIGIVSRFAMQKGFDLLFTTLPEILSAREFAMVVLGSGEAPYEEFFATLARDFPERVSYQRGYDEPLAHLIEAGSDMFLMPSLYEPCGLNQMYSLKYGTVPIVRRTGGLADSVQMWNAATEQGTGILFNDFDAPAVRWALHTSLDLFKDRKSWRRMMLNGMAQDFSWERQGTLYEKLFADMLAVA